MAATKQVKILQLGPKKRGEKRSASIEVREPLTTHPTAGESIDSAAVLRRFPAAELAYEVVQQGYDLKKHGGLWKIIFNRPVTETDIFNVLVKTAALLGKTEADVLATGTARPGSKVKIGRMSLLGDTSKMGCYSFNLPAGPRDLLGACPAADPGFMFLRPDQRAAAQRGMRVPVPIHVGNYICNGCVVGDTKVLVRGRGLVSVEVLEGEAEEFEVWSGKAWRSAKAVFTGYKPIFELETSWGASLQLTSDHQVLTQDRGWVEAQALEEGDRLVFEPPTAHHIPPQAIRFDCEKTHHNQATAKFPETWSTDVGAVLGYLLGDGCITQGCYPTISAVFSTVDIEAAQKLQKIVGSWVETNTQLRKITEKHEHNSLVGELVSEQVGLHWRVQSLAAFLTHLGLDKSVGCDNLRAPSSIWEAGTDGVRGFLSGLFGADGSVGASSPDKVEVSLASTSLGLLKDAQQLLFSFFGIRSTFSSYSSNAKRGFKPLHKLCINSDHHVRLFASSVGFFTPRKQQVLESLMRDRQEKNRVARYPHVKGVEKVSELVVPVYDLQVEVDHAFVANGITIHNCYALKGSYGNPNQTIHQQIKFFVTQQWLAAPSLDKRYSSRFVELMVQFIQLSQEKSLNRRKKISKSRWWQTPHPSYFRLHDAGDFFTPEYTRAWFEIIRALPNILFWAPTRMWIMKGGASTVFAHGIPDNLALRPSALHFGEMPPEVYAPGTKEAMVLDLRAPGLSAPSGAAKSIPPGVWECPAMLHKTEGGGAEPKLITEGPKQGKPQLDKAGQPVLKAGMCARAHGPGSPFRGGKDKEDTPNQGGGCRVCWRNRALPVFYHEH